VRSLPSRPATGLWELKVCFQLFWPRCQHRQRCCDELRHSNCCHRERHRNMGVRSVFTWQSHPWGFPRCNRCYSDNCCQGKCFLTSLFTFLRCSQIQASGQRIEYFERLQLQCKFPKPLRIPLHSNVRWGSAHGMLERSYKLRQVSNHPGLIVFLH
jgi:hypothetical protein